MLLNFSDDILCLICSFSHDETLAALAQTSKQVSQAAVKIRWAHITSLERLRHPMPLDAYTILWNGRNIVISFTRDLTPNEVERVRKYAALVRTITVYDKTTRTPHLRFDTAAWAIFMKHFGPRDFPRLHTINAGQSIEIGENPYLDEDDHISRLHHIMGPSLRNLQLRVSYLPEYGDPRYDDRYVPITEQESRRPNIITPILLNLASAPLDIRNLEVSTSASVANFVGLLSNVICQLHHLSTCILWGRLFIQPSALKHLASLPSLHELRLAIHQADYKDGLESYLSDLDRPFHALRDLNLYVDESGCCIGEFIRSIRSTQFQRFSITIEEHVSGDSTVAILSTLTTHPSAPSLTCLTLNLGVPHLEGLERHKLLESSSFSHLSSFSALEQVRIYGKYFGGLDNETLQAVAYGCPSLKVLSIDPGWKQRNDWPRVSLTTLEILLQRCRRLYALSLHLYINSVEVKNALGRTERNPSYRPQSELQSLQVSVSPIPCKSDVYGPLAVLLSLWTPQLRGIWLSGEDGCRVWSEVRDLLKPLELVRKQERQWLCRDGGS